jgi:hypothetical protein
LKRRACRQVVVGFAGFLGFALLPEDLAPVDLGLKDLALEDLALEDLRDVTGLMAMGLPAGAAATGSGPGRKNARQPGESCDLLRIMQAVTRSTSGISEPQSRNASPVQACCCSGV